MYVINPRSNLQRMPVQHPECPDNNEYIDPQVRSQ